MSPLGVQFGASSRSKIGGAYFSDVTGSIKDMIECPNNWGVGSVFPTLENTYFLTKSPIAGSEPNHGELPILR